MPTHGQIDTAIRAVNEAFDGMSGNCARFAAILNRVIRGAGEYVLVDSGHYEFCDHVYLKHEGYLFDSDGVTTLQALEEQCAETADDEDGDPITIQFFSDPSSDGTDVRRTVDEASPLAARWLDEALETALRQAFSDIGVHLEDCVETHADPNVHCP